MGATFAYFTATVQDDFSQDGSNGTTSIETAKVASKTVVANSDSEAGKFTAEEVYPGHKEVAAIKVTVTGEEGDTSAIAIDYKISQNGLGEDATITVYGLESPLSIGNGESNYFECEKKTKSSTSGDKTLYYEECKSNEDKNLEAVKKLTEKTKKQQTVTIPSSGTLTFEDIITVSSEEAVKYYYVVIEYENDDTEDGSKDQNTQMAQKLEGNIEVRAA